MKKYIIFCLGLFCFIQINGQEGNETQADMVVEASTSHSSINVSWYPVQPKVWKKLLPVGYRLKRQELDKAGNPLGSPVLLQENILPQTQQWFLDNQSPEAPLVEPVGALLYDQDFDFEPGEEFDETELKFNYIAYEASSDPIVAYAVGLGYMDKDAEPGKHYRYLVEAQDGSISGQVDILGVLYAMAQNPATSPREFKFPGNLSLSAMYNQSTPVQDNSIVGLARAYGDSIVVRWAPPNALIWESAKKDGFKLYRTEGWGEPELLAEVKPRPKSEMDASLLEQDSIAFMAAGLLYGQFNEPADMGLYNQMNMSENYFGIAMMAAEQSSLAADILGFRYVDKLVKDSAEYTYMISTPSLPRRTDIGMVNIRNVYTPLAAPIGFHLTPGDQHIRLNWNRYQNINQFSYYKVERSRDGVNYEQINGAPIVFMDSDIAEYNNYFFVDSVGVNDVSFHYRLYGGNSFGEWSIPAEGQITAVDLTPPSAAQIIFAEYQDSLNRFSVEWVQQQELPEDFSHYQVMMSETREGFYDAVSEQLDAEVDSFLFDVSGLGLEGRYFFKIASEDQKGNRIESQAFPARVPDITPPDIPVDLKGYIDSLGRVEVTWQPSEAEDIRGYWLYWANDPEEEMSLVSQEIITENYHSWYINAKSLNKEIYFCLRAEDKSYNRSNPSEVLPVERPDHIPPIPPVIQPVKVADGALDVTWKPSPSKDVRHNLLYKRNTLSQDTSWFLLDTIEVDTGAYLDMAVRIDSAYQYKIRSVDHSGNVSDFSAVSQGILPFPAESVVIENLLIENPDGISSRLVWKFSKSDFLKDYPFVFDIYRSTGTGGLQKVDSTPATSLSYSDQGVLANVLYNYAVRVRFENGWVGDLSEVKSVLIE